MSLPSASSSSHAHAHAASPVYSNSNSNNNNKSSGGNKKPSSKNDLLRCAVGLLLKQKNYVVSDLSPHIPFIQQCNGLPRVIPLGQRTLPAI